MNNGGDMARFYAAKPGALRTPRTTEDRAGGGAGGCCPILPGMWWLTPENFWNVKENPAYFFIREGINFVQLWVMTGLYSRLSAYETVCSSLML